MATMQAQLLKVREFLAISDWVYVIPVYQRDYIWGEKECRQLWSDILEVVSGHRENHFIGSAICKTDEQVENGTVVIDGQQRMMTLFLLFRAIVELLDDTFDKRVLAERYLVNRNALDDGLRLRLRPVDGDINAYRKVMHWETPVTISLFTDIERQSHIVENYFYLYECVNNTVVDGIATLESIIKAIEGLGIIKISLGDENPQLIFESINSTGKSLESYDLVRNYILMRLPYSEQSLVYDKYWRHVEHYVHQANGKEALSEFLLNWLLIQRQSNSFGRYGRKSALTVKVLYEGYKEFFEDIVFDIGSLGDTLADMVAYAESYACVYGYQEGFTSEKLFSDVCSTILNDIKSKQAVLVLMWLHRMYSLGRISENDLDAMSQALLCYCVRAKAAWGVAGARATNISAQTACLLIARFNTNFSESDDAVKIFWQALTSFSGEKSAFVSDADFIEGLSRTDIYNKGNVPYVTYLLYEINSGLSKELPQRTASITLEHIMPKTLSDEWRIELSQVSTDVETDHVKHLNMLGNLCLTAYNSELSNNSFSRKRDIYSKSAFVDTRSIGDREDWTFEDIEKRTYDLAVIACDIWSVPDEYSIVNEFEEGVWYRLDTDIDSLYEYSPTRVDVVGNEKAVSTWASFMEKILGELYQLDAKTFEQCVISFSAKQARIVSSDPHVFRRHQRIIGTNYYVNTNRNWKQLYSWCLEFVRLFSSRTGLNLSDEIRFMVKHKV